MSSESRVMWFGRILGVIVAYILIHDVIADNGMSQASRLMVICIAGLTFFAVFFRQCQIAYKYEGVPIIPLAFRWVVAMFFGSLALFVGWLLIITMFPSVYSTWLSTLIWLQLGESALWFASRWWTVGRPQLAGPGETGATGNGNGG